ncbi:MAG TPA: undecaprenyl-diphosphate phosphatase [Longimicrobiales bacterium]|nr:undecaprenyl-diphosphate phosphatase [Longimicrobiales bacterium]
MTPWEAAILGFVQGATEFLPVSSSGHLVIGEELLGVTTPGVLFEVAVHVATLVSILLVYRTRVADLAVGALCGQREALRYVGMIVLATVPAGLVGVLAGDFVESLFDSPTVVGVSLLITGVLLWSTRWAMARANGPVPTWTAALLIGIAQAFAITPGISRSGTTVVAALWLGVEPREAAAFSFLMAVPAIAGAGVLQIPELANGGGLGWAALALGSLVAAVTGVLAIRTLVLLLARRAFHLFAPYCWAAGALFLVYLAVR